MDVVAPSGAISNILFNGNCPDPGGGAPLKYPRRELLGDVWTIDIKGIPSGSDFDRGWNPGVNFCPDYLWTELIWSSRSGEPSPTNGYTAHFGGTSAAAPQVSGVAALILSLAPDLEATLENPQVQDVIRFTADDMGPISGHDNDYGYGRLNAHQALDLIISPPAAPQNLTATAVQTSGGYVAQLDWDANTEADLNGYDIHRKVSGAQAEDWKKIGTSSTNNYTGYDDLYFFFGSGSTIHYKVKARDINDNSSPFSNEDTIDDVIILPKQAAGEDDTPAIPLNFELKQNYPNPFNPTTTITFALPESGPTQLQVFDLSGKLVAELLNRELDSGFYEVSFDASQLGSGIYIYRLTAGKFIQSHKMTLLK